MALTALSFICKPNVRDWRMRTITPPVKESESTSGASPITQSAHHSRHLNLTKSLPKTKHKRFHLLILPKPLVLLLGSIMPLFAQNLSTPLLMTFPRFLTLSSSTGDVSTFSKPFAETPLKLFTLYTIKISKPFIKKQSIPPIYCEF